MKITKNLGMLLLAIWLIVGGVVPLLELNIPRFATIMDVLGIAAGVCILIGK